MNTTEYGKLEITLYDADGNELDKYTVDRRTGEGTNSANEEVSLPQTGNNNVRELLIMLAALMMTASGAAAIILSGKRRHSRKDRI